MYQSSRGSSRNHAGLCASLGLLLAVTLGFSAACDSDDSEPATSAGGTSGQATGAAGAGDPLRGEGFEPTPTFDITNPDREPPSRDELVEGVLNLGVGGSNSGVRPPADAGSPDGGDAS